MNKQDKELELLITKYMEELFKKIGLGIKSIIKKRRNGIGLLISIVLTAVIFFILKEGIANRFFEENQIQKLEIIKYFILIIPVMYIYILGSRQINIVEEFNRKFEAINFCGYGKVYPKFLSEEKDGKKIIYSFYSMALNVTEWVKKYSEIETALDCNIVKIETAKTTKQVIKIHTVPTLQGLEDYLSWDNEILEDDFKITVGRAMLRDVIFDLNALPHALIAGVTGSGKSVILRCILWQCIVKGAKIYMVDFKGGVEFGEIYEQFGEVVVERQRAIEVLKELTRENTMRLKRFRQTGVKNLAEYNRKFPEDNLCRIILVCDEVAEMLDKTGVGKEEKGFIEEIEKEMSTLARLSRAPGINMLLGTQRPDAKVITGQIKNNLPIRISGRMIDSQASEMVLGNTKATELPETKGRFMYNVGADTYEFQAFYFDDNKIRSGDYQKGKMLLYDNAKKEEIKWEEDEQIDEWKEDEEKSFLQDDWNNEDISEYKGFL